VGTLARRAFVSGLGSAVALAALPAAAKPRAPSSPPLPVLPLSIAVAVEGGRAVREEAWIQAQLAEVERLYGPIGLRFKRTAARALPEPTARLESREDRDSLDAERMPRVNNAFLVASMRDVDDTRIYRMGVHWRNTVTPSHRYVIVAADAITSTLAHELGHYFGLPHAHKVDNLMSYSRTGEKVFISNSQAATIRAMARIALASGELVDPDAA
jgi:hypothetical protein